MPVAVLEYGLSRAELCQRTVTEKHFMFKYSSAVVMAAVKYHSQEEDNLMWVSLTLQMV